MYIYSAILMVCLAGPAFAAEVSPLTLLSDAEQSYHTQVFDYAMDTIPADGHYDWASYGGNGSLAIAQQFTSKSGYVCRGFTETFSVQKNDGSEKGYGCRRIGKTGWCRLRESDALTCAMEGTPLIPGVNITTSGSGTSSSGIGSVGGNTDVSTPGVHTGTGAGANMNISGDGKSHKPTATGYADTVTGTAGSLGGKAAEGSKSLFNDLFR